MEMKIIVKTNDGRDLGMLVKFLKTVEQCCLEGASRDLILSVDGDGSANMKFEFEEVEGTYEILPADLGGVLRFDIGE